MSLYEIDGNKLKEMVLAGATYLESNKQTVNALNVFPVPDGDTGTNMTLTMKSASAELAKVGVNSISKVAAAMSSGSLKGARGNSGVILSQILRGFSKSIENETTINTRTFAKALENSSEMAYKSVMKPVEGTMLTVIRMMAKESKALAARYSDFIDFLNEILKVAKDTLDQTPNLLPALKKAGVVDSGGMGLLYIFMGMTKLLEGEMEITPSEAVKPETALPGKSMTPAASSSEEIEYGYCTEFLVINLHSFIKKDDIGKLQRNLELIGNSVVLVADDNMIKVHVHTEMPGNALQIGLRYGQLTGIKIDNMREQHGNLEENESSGSPSGEVKETAIVAVSPGDGITELFKSLGVNGIISGGQTMNPSASDILDAIEKVNAKKVIVLPNNGNIVMAARQAAEMSNHQVHVLAAKTIPQGFSALVSYDPDQEFDKNIAAMEKATANVHSGEVTYAVRDTEFDGKVLREGDIMGIDDEGIQAVGNNLNVVSAELIDKMAVDGAEVITIYYGNGIDTDMADKLSRIVSERYPDADVEIYNGGQPVYYYLISVE